MKPKSSPHSVEAEQSLLGGIMLANRAWDDVSDQIVVDDFYRNQHKVIWNALSDLSANDQPCDFVTVVEHLRRKGELEAAGGVSYVGTLANDTPSAANVSAYAGIVREKSILRGVLDAGLDIAKLVYEPDGSGVDQLLDHAEQKIMAIRDKGARGTTGTLQLCHVLPEVQRKLMAVTDSSSKTTGLSSGLDGLDQMTSGFHPGDMIIIAGRPSMGKTTLATNIAEHVAFGLGLPVVIFSMEMSAEQIGYRIVSSQGRIEQNRLRNGALSDQDMDQITWTVGRLRAAPIFIDETGSLSPMDLRARARRLARRTKPALIVVDYVQLMQVPGIKDNRTNEIAEISRNLKSLAKELGAPIIVLSQLNRSLEQRENKRPRLSDLRESGGLEQDADIVLFIYRHEVYDPESAEKGEAEIIVAKQRNGPIGKVAATFQGQYCKFQDRQIFSAWPEEGE